MRAVLINASHPQYNLGLQKLSSWLTRAGWHVDFDHSYLPLFSAELVAFSAIFSWDVPKLCRWANEAKRNGRVWIGGPAASFCSRQIQEATGITPTVGLDERFEQEPGNYKYVYTSRGCPVKCSFCPVWKIEGESFTLYKHWAPAPMLCDNNLTDLPIWHQTLAAERFKDWGKRFDANSGFEPTNFRKPIFDIWDATKMTGWRLGCDEIEELDRACAMIASLREWGVPQNRIWVYCMIGHEPIAACYARAEAIVRTGGMPKVQPFIPLTATTRTPRVAHDWTLTRLRAFAKFYWHCHWKRRTLRDFKLRSGAMPFADVPLAA